MEVELVSCCVEGRHDQPEDLCCNHSTFLSLATTVGDGNAITAGVLGIVLGIV